jgi:hypothetical protein
MAWKPRVVNKYISRGPSGIMEEIYVMENDVYEPLLNDLLVLLYNL